MEIARLLRPEEVADITGITPKALARRRQRGLGPPWIKPPGLSRVYYDAQDLQDWIASGRHQAKG